MSYTPYTDHETININQVVGGDNLYYTTTYKCQLVVEPINVNSGTCTDPILYIPPIGGVVEQIRIMNGFISRSPSATSNLEVHSVIVPSGATVRLSLASGVCNLNLHVFRID